MLGIGRAEWRETKAIIGKEQLSLMSWKRRCLVLCLLDKIHVLSKFRHDYEVVLFLS